MIGYFFMQNFNWISVMSLHSIFSQVGKGVTEGDSHCVFKNLQIKQKQQIRSVLKKSLFL
jgi:hypothetical protein